LNQTQELARVKARIKALAEKTVANGCTEAEALSSKHCKKMLTKPSNG
jgi:hypothetical protein